MPLTPEQQAEIDEQRAQPRPTPARRVRGMEKHLYLAHQVLDHGLVRRRLHGRRFRDHAGPRGSLWARHEIPSARMKGLIRYLMRHWHSTPFEMCEVKFTSSFGLCRPAMDPAPHRQCERIFGALFHPRPRVLHSAPEHFGAILGEPPGRGSELLEVPGRPRPDLLRDDAMRSCDHEDIHAGTAREGLAGNWRG